MMNSSIIRMGDNVALNRQTQYNAYGPESECHRYDERVSTTFCFLSSRN